MMNEEEYIEEDMNDFYPNGEKITCHNIRQEPWYQCYSVVLRTILTGPNKKEPTFYELMPNGFGVALKKIKETIYSMENKGKVPTEKQLKVWIKSVWMSEDQIENIKDLSKICNTNFQ